MSMIIWGAFEWKFQGFSKQKDYLGNTGREEDWMKEKNHLRKKVKKDLDFTFVIDQPFVVFLHYNQVEVQVHLSLVFTLSVHILNCFRFYSVKFCWSSLCGCRQPADFKDIMEQYDLIVNQPVVIDNGSGVIKAGFAGDQIPKCHFPNFIGRPKHTRVMAGALEGDLFVGPKAQEHRGLLSIRYPMEHGIVTDWNDMERIWQYIYSKDQLQTFSEEHPVLLTEAPLNPRRNREKAAEIFFETFNVPALFLSMQVKQLIYMKFLYPLSLTLNLR